MMLDIKRRLSAASSFARIDFERTKERSGKLALGEIGDENLRRLFARFDVANKPGVSANAIRLG